jgi:hypothetical protein
LPARGAHQERRLDVAMRDPFGVRGLERVGHLHRNLDNLRRREIVSFDFANFKAQEEWGAEPSKCRHDPRHRRSALWRSAI